MQNIAATDPPSAELQREIASWALPIANDLLTEFYAACPFAFPAMRTDLLASHRTFWHSLLLDETARVARRSDLASIMRGTALTAAHLEMADAKVLRELIDIVVLRFRRSHVRAEAHYAVLHAMARRLKAAVENAGVLREGSRRGRRDQQRSAAA